MLNVITVKMYLGVRSHCQYNLFGNQGPLLKGSTWLLTGLECERQSMLTKSLTDFQSNMPSACDSLIEDIEDMVSSSDPTPHERQSARKSIIPRSRKKKEPLNHEELQADRYVKWVNQRDCDTCGGMLTVTLYFSITLLTTRKIWKNVKR